MLSFKTKALLKTIAPPLTGDLVMTATIFIAKTLYLQDETLVQFCTLAIIGAAAYLASTLILDRIWNTHIRETIKEQLQFVLRKT